MIWLVLIFWATGFVLLWKIPLLPKSASSDILGLSISVIVPARNEGQTLNRLLMSLRSQVVAPKEIIVVDDHSSDETASIAIANGAVLIPSAPVPEGWLGKPWACWQGAEAALGDILIFLDADTYLEPKGIARILSAYKKCGGLLSVQPFHTMEKHYERLSAFFNIITMAGTGAFSLLCPNINPRGAFGPCLVCPRQDYLALGGHYQARHMVLESLGLAEAFKRVGFSVSYYGGKGAVYFRMYPDGFRSMVEGFSRGFAEGANAISIPMFVLIVAWVTGGMSVARHVVQALLTTPDIPILAWACLYAGFSLQLHWMLRRIGNFGLLTCMLYPIPSLFFVLVFFRSLLLKAGIGKASWKGRVIR
ncbi:MAG: glycosyltransferase family A protein [Candidatus Desulfacyla sp.]